VASWHVGHDERQDLRRLDGLVAPVHLDQLTLAGNGRRIECDRRWEPEELLLRALPLKPIVLAFPVGDSAGLFPLEQSRTIPDFTNPQQPTPENRALNLRLEASTGDRFDYRVSSHLH